LQNTLQMHFSNHPFALEASITAGPFDIFVPKQTGSHDISSK